MSRINPQAFFERARTFVSQGRGEITFTLEQKLINNIINNNPRSNASAIRDGLQMLQEGITAKSVTLPGQQLATYDAPPISGPQRRVGHQIMFSDLEVEFYLVGKTPQEAASVYYALRGWQRFIAGPVDARDSLPVSDSTAFASAYYDDVIATAEVRLYGPDSTTAIRMQLTEVFPLTLGALQASWENSDAPLNFSATFAHFYNETATDLDIKQILATILPFPS